MPIFTGIATALFAGTALAGTFAVGATAFALQVAAGVGISYAARALAGRPQQQQPAANRGVGGVQGTLQASGDVPRSFPLGRSLTAGSLVYANFWGNDGETPNAFLTQVIAVSDLPVAGLTRVFVNGEAATLLTGEAHAERGWPVQEYRQGGKDHLWIKFHDGTQASADTFVSNRVATEARPWGPSRIGAGVAYCVCTALVNDKLFTGFPAFRFELPGIALYDISKDTTAGGSGAHRWSDPATWGGDGDDLPAVQLYNLLRGVMFDGAWLYGLQAMSAARLPAVAWINAVNTCRTSIAGEDGNEATYRAGHECRVSTRIADAVEVLLTACHGRLAEIGGAYKMRAGAPGDYVATFTDANILSSEEQTFTPFFGLAQKITGISGAYPEPEEAWQIKGAPPLNDADLEEKAGNRRLLSDVRFDAVPYAAQVQRLMKSALLAAQRARRHTFAMPPEWVLIEPLDVVRWTSARNGYSEKLFEVDGLLDQPGLDQLVDLTEVDPSDYDWTHNDDFTPVSRSPIAFQRPAAQAIVDWTAEGVIIADASGFKRRAAILLQWDGDQDDVAGVAFEVRDATATVIHRGRTDNLEAGAIYISQNILPNEDYEVRGRYLPSNPRDTLFSDWIAVSTPDVRQTLVEFENWIRHQVSTLQDQFRDEIDNLKAALANAANQDARNWNDKQTLRRQFNSRTDEAFAQVEEAIEVATSTQQAFASFTTTVTASFDDLTAFVEQTAEAVAGVETIGARYAITLDVNGYASGFELLNGGGGFSTATFNVANFRIVNPSYSPKAVFTVGTINGAPAIGIAGTVFLDGTLNAIAIKAGDIDALQLKEDGIPIGKLIENAVGRHWTADIGSPVATVHNTEAALFSRTITLPVASVVSIIGSVTFVEAATGVSLDDGIYSCATTQFASVRVYIAGSLVKDIVHSPSILLKSVSSVIYSTRLPSRVTLPIVKSVYLPAGTYAIEVRGHSNNFSFATADPGVTFDAGGVGIFQQHKITLN